MDSPRLNRAGCYCALLMLGMAMALWVSPEWANSQTEPSVPSSQPVDPAAAKAIAKLLDGLANPSQQVRDDARRELMGLQRPDLPVLQAVVRSRGQLLPSQASSLYDIVAHIYASGDDYQQESQGFLGLWWDPWAQDEGETRVTVQNRVLGFCGYRMLEEGDVFISVTPPDGDSQPIHTVEDVRINVASCKPGDVVTFELLRHGKVIRVPVQLDGRPSAINSPADLQSLRSRRENDAQDYWDREFAPLIQGDVS